MDPYIKRKIIKKQGASFEEIEDRIAVEKKLRIFLGKKEIISLYCTPSMVKELIAGLLLTEEILSNKISSDEISIEENGEIKAFIPFSEDKSSGKTSIARYLCGFTFGKDRDFKKIEDYFSVSTEDLMKIFREFNQKAELFRLTGCFHSAALSDGKGIPAFAEDVGRHNAVDKVVGYAILNDISFYRKLMMVSCRISSEIVSKCARWQIPILASRAAPTDLAIEIAESSGMTLIGFVRGESLNIYTNPQRIVL